MNVLPLILTISLCLFFSVTVFILRDRLQQMGRSPVRREAGNDLPFDGAA